MLMIKALWAYRGFVFASVKREFQSKYQNSLFGAVWSIINPLSMIFVYTVVFSQVMQTKLPNSNNSYAYSVYLCSGVLTWGLFSEIVSRGQNIFLDNANFIKKVNFPRLCLPAIMIINACVNFSIVFSLFIIFMILTGQGIGWTGVAFIPVLLIQLLFATGLGVSLGVINVFFRDVGLFFGIFMQFWFWLTPVVYPSSVLPKNIEGLMELNPMYSIINSYQRIFVADQWPNWDALLYPLGLSLLLCALGFRIFRLHAGEMVDEL